MRAHLFEARVGRLATVGADGRPQVVPVTFAADGESLFFAVDAKPKRTNDLKRLRNIAANPAVSVLVDHYEDDWTRLWWVRVDGTARVVEDTAHALELLADNSEQHGKPSPPGPGPAISIDRMTGWAAADNPAC